MTLQAGEIIAIGFAGDRIKVVKGDQVDITLEPIGTLSNTLGSSAQ
jgi:5-oxopent-3-ene-1,2,5-tricarboxylate decarboxylase/2-hydroxyhepta-2,4-diene-1,7-dioate isomerase